MLLKGLVDIGGDELKNQKTKYDVNTHFNFGDNWQNYSLKIGRGHIDNSKKELLELIGIDGLENKSFLEIGSGSGIHSLAALELGVKNLLAVDIDPNSVKTTKEVISKNWD